MCTIRAPRAHELLVHAQAHTYRHLMRRICGLPSHNKLLSFVLMCRESSSHGPGKSLVHGEGASGREDAHAWKTGMKDVRLNWFPLRSIGWSSCPRRVWDDVVQCVPLYDRYNYSSQVVLRVELVYEHYYEYHMLVLYYAYTWYYYSIAHFNASRQKQPHCWYHAYRGGAIVGWSMSWAREWGMVLNYVCSSMNRLCVWLSRERNEQPPPVTRTAGTTTVLVVDTRARRLVHAG